MWGAHDFDAGIYFQRDPLKHYMINNSNNGYGIFYQSIFFNTLILHYYNAALNYHSASYYACDFIINYSDPSGYEIEYESDQIAKHPFKEDPSLKKSGDSYTFGETNDAGGSSVGCVCIPCKPGLKIKCKVQCTVSLHFEITLYPNTIAAWNKIMNDAGHPNEIRTEQGVYGHEKAHVSTQINRMRDYLKTKSDTAKKCNGSEDACSKIAADLAKEIQATLNSIEAQAHAHTDTDFGGPKSGVSMPDNGADIPTATKSGGWTGGQNDNNEEI
jgi:hypothetical protein